VSPTPPGNAEAASKEPQVSPPLPRSAIIDVFDACNLRCPLCPTGARVARESPARMSTERFVDILAQMPDLQIVHLFNWGEPLLHPQIIELVRIASSRRIASTIHSNLSVERPGEFFADLVRAGLVALVASIDGASQQSYERYRRGGDLNLVLGNLAKVVSAKRALRSRTPSIVWKFIINRHNEHEVEQARALATEMGASFITAPMGLGEDLLDWTPEGSLTARAESWLPEAERHWSQPMQNGEFGVCSYDTADAAGYCKWPRTGIIINPRGFALPCPFITRDDSAFGNVFESSVADVWTNHKYTRARMLRRGAEPQVQTESPIACDRCPMVSGEQPLQLTSRKRRL
jgi:MoaA/NifB/PqqE/SkfB family radical SAM enzyme